MALTHNQLGCENSHSEEILHFALDDIRETLRVHHDWQAYNAEVMIQTRSQATRISPRTSTTKNNNKRKRKNKTSSMPTPCIVGNKYNISPLKSWIGNQLSDQPLPDIKTDALISSLEGYPDGLLAVPSTTGGKPRIIVPIREQKSLVMQTHEDIHHQGHQKVLHVLYPSFYWPNMESDVEKWCQECEKCARAKVRRRHLKSQFNSTLWRIVLLASLENVTASTFMEYKMVKFSSS